MKWITGAVGLLALGACSASPVPASPTVTVTQTVERTITVTLTESPVTATAKPTAARLSPTQPTPPTGLVVAFRKAFPESQFQTESEITDHAQDGCDTIKESVEWADDGVDGLARYMLLVNDLWLEEYPVITQFACSTYRPAAVRALAGLTDGNFEVAAKVSAGEFGSVALPGTYTTDAPVRDCFWERSTGSGGTIANDFVSNAPKGLTVRIRPTDGGFKSEGCGTWLPAQ